MSIACRIFLCIYHSKDTNLIQQLCDNTNSKIPECKILISYTTLTSAYELFLVNSEAS